MCTYTYGHKFTIPAESYLHVDTCVCVCHMYFLCVYMLIIHLSLYANKLLSTSPNHPKTSHNCDFESGNQAVRLYERLGDIFIDGVPQQVAITWTANCWLYKKQACWFPAGRQHAHWNGKHCDVLDATLVGSTKYTAVCISLGSVFFVRAPCKM